MAWDFSTDPEFQDELDWIDAFVRDEIEPLDALWGDLAYVPLDERLRTIVDPLKDQVRARGLWACHLGPELGGQGYGQLKLASDERDPRPLVVGADRVRQPGARLRQRRDPRPLRHRRAEAALPPAAARRRDLLLLLDDRAAGRLRSVAVPHPRRARRRRVGDQRREVLLVERLVGRLRHRDGHHRSRRARVPGLVDVPRADRHAGTRSDPRRSAPAASPSEPACTRTCATTTCACRPRTCSAARARASRSRRPGSAAAASTTRCARSRNAGRPSTCSASAP